MKPVSRRTLLQAGVVAFASAIAGCASSDRTNDLCSDDSPEKENVGIEPADGAPFPSLPDGTNWPLTAFDSTNTRYNPHSTGPLDQPRAFWSLELDVPDRKSPPAVSPILDDDTLYLNDGYRRIVAVDAASGDVRWRSGIVPTQQPPAAVDGMLYVGNEEGIHAMDAETQDRAWTFTPTELAGQQATTAGPRPTPQPTADDGSEPTVSEMPQSMSAVIVTDSAIYGASGWADDSKVYALDPETGEQRWSIPGHSVAAVTDEAAFVYRNGTVSAVSPADGTVQWAKKNLTATGKLAVSNGQLFGSHDLGTTSAFDAETGEEYWTFEGEIENMALPSVSDSTVYVGSSPTEGRDGGNLYALNAASGDVEWCAHLGWESVAPPVIADETIFVGQSGGIIQARDAADGTLRWQFYERYAWFANLAVVGDALFAGTENGALYAFGEGV